MKSMTYSLNFGIKAISIITCFALLACSERDSITIIENIGENDSLSIMNITTWGDTPFWVDSMDHYSFSKLDSFDLEQFKVNGTRLNDFVESLSDSDQTDGVEFMVNDENSIEFELKISDFTLIHRLDTISNWRIEKFKKEFPNSYNWRNVHRDGYEANLDFKVDSIHDVIAFKTGYINKIIIHLVNGQPRTFRIILEKKLITS